MSKQAIIGFFKPSLWTFVILGIFLPVAYFGHIQTYAFTCGGDGHKCVGTDIQKPPLFDEIRGYPFWLVWVFSIAPLSFAQAPILITTPEGATASVIYFYVASCVVAFFWKKFRRIRWFDDPPQQVKS